ncbi:MAG: NUDIX hydrolase, partial [Candidatus Nanoarchaeia archaeon]
MAKKKRKSKVRYRRAVFIVVYRKTLLGVRYLLLKRKLHWTGWEFPKGGLDKNEKYEKAVKREVKEETGKVPINVKKFKQEGRYAYPK